MSPSKTNAALLKIAGGAVITGLTLLGKTLEAITGFLADNKAITITLAALFAAQFLPSITAMVAGITAMGRAITGKVIAGLVQTIKGLRSR